VSIPIFQVDAFTNRVFQGNPAAVCLLPEWLADNLMQAIAAENNLAETAFVVPRGNAWHIRWFTPRLEVDLCGHATLASAFVLFETARARGRVTFHSQSGPLDVTQEAGGLLVLDFPARRPLPCPLPAGLEQALDVKVAATLAARDLLVVVNGEQGVRRLTPDMDALARLTGYLGIIVTARGETADFVSRFFAPNVGVDEDPVTGSAHCTLVPYWADVLGKKKLHALQVSPRGGELFCEDRGERILIGGRAALYLKGEIFC